MTITLLGSYNGVELIRHELKRFGLMGFNSSPTSAPFEGIVLVKGSLRVAYDSEVEIVGPGAVVTMHPVKGDVCIIAMQDAEFIYISSAPIFDSYRRGVERFHQMATEIAQKDGYTASHCERIRKYSVLIGCELGLSARELLSLSCGALFHDIGKTQIPDEILRKPGRLTPEEFDIMKMHTIYGRDMMSSPSNPFLHIGSTVAEQHHERYDGSGYPYGLKGEEIYLPAAIVAVVDSYDAMTSKRPYQRPKSKQEAIDEIRALRGKLYDPRVVDAFLKVVSTLDDL
ncbi:HD-GYP domain-containing protein [Alicyclobacillus acidocaldarius]|uniref:Metal dependent phosphohydrolase n=1 Tax=Alicyclobacillus acidocaldarius (strain Tc-4-1) TaxID=1048834 RepID=F8II10_ALIAT|nr:HD-GYP domain-containing protein [Alicyclobacillus acidocaldarius]AEJ44490.1 metal dependent phosphohydrolase [Alicyclobacillus acidocaldarius subsp. acidocaldarius Tc-4-1]